MGIKCNYKKEFKKYRVDIKKGHYKSYKEQYNFFYDKYVKEMDEDPEFNFNDEKSMIQFKVNNKYESALSMYVSGVISLILFYSSTFIGNKIAVWGIIIIAFSIILWSIIELMKGNILSDMWNIALIALENLEKENEYKELNEQIERVEKSLKSMEEINLDIRRIKQFIDIR